MIKLNFKVINFIKEDRGQVFSMDVLFALIIITIAIGMSADALDVVSFKISDYSAGRSLDRIATDAADVLVNTPGTPNWEKTNTTQSIVPGLAQDNNGSKNTTKVLSFTKISQLTINYPELMGNVIPLGVNSSLTIYPAGSDIKPLVVGNGTPPPDVTEVAVVNRTVLVDFSDFRILASVTGDFSQEVCPHENFTGVAGHGKVDDNSTLDWNCRNFKVTQEDLNTTDFYILTDPTILGVSGAKWILDRPDMMSEEQQTFQAHPILVNDRIYELIGSGGGAVVWLHVLDPNEPSKSFNTYLIGVPRGTAPEKVRIEYLHPQTCFFILKIWME